MKRKNSGFTLIELMTVVGVLLLLMALSVIAFKVVARSARANQTKVTLNNLNAMVGEFDAAAGSNALPTYASTTIGAGVSAHRQNWTIGNVAIAPLYPPSGWTSDRYGWIVQQTQGAMQTLMRVANNSKAVAQLPSSRLLRDSSGNPVAGPILLDGWGNPIVYVPAGGIIVNVTTGNGVAQLVTIKSSDNRPFFASAGPDGDFGAVNSPAQSPTAGDDNIYSKE